MKRNILITGGAGFIGSHVVRLFVNKYPDYRIVNLDKLTYAGNLANLRDIENAPNYTFVKADICDYDTIREVFCKYDIDGVIHLAAEPRNNGTTTGRGNASIIFRPTKYMVRCNSTARSSQRKPATIPTPPIRRPKPRPTISCGPTTTPTVCRRS